MASMQSSQRVGWLDREGERITGRWLPEVPETHRANKVRVWGDT